MQRETPVCRLCASKRTRCLGAIPDNDFFAGRVLSQPIMGGHLWTCESCLSMFRHPVLPDSTYLCLYAKGAEGERNTVGGREDLAIVRKIIIERGGSPD